ncbi:MAG: 2OG-Fe(II) oxygenase [Streptosporangiales bacterium]|nr:2OG-Fe(II) oxygenase [Streptosporangiales bacterium]
MGGRARLGVGERAPDFTLVGTSGSAERFYAYAGGRPTALVFARDGADPRMVELIDLLAGREDVAVTPVTDPSVAEAYGVPREQLTVVVLDPSLRVMGVVTEEKPSTEVVALLDAALHRGPPTEVNDQAPVLFISRVLDADQRDRLIRIVEQEGNVETGVERSASGGSRGGEILDANYKRRRDHTVTDPDLLRDLSSVIGRRIMPEIRKAFAFRATRFEGFKIACYDASTGGFFRPHRDNLSPSTAHRVFALTLNLNDAYEGGQLRFPEYGNQLYRPEAGAALVFSCAHLHEVRDVTAGRRFVLLSFLYGERASSAAR